MMQHKASHDIQSIKNILPELTVSLQINTWVCGGASVDVHVKAEKKKKNTKKTPVSARPEMEVDDVSIKSADVLHCAFWEVSVIKGDFKYSVN